jgi:hypothetical protein
MFATCQKRKAQLTLTKRAQQYYRGLNFQFQSINNVRNMNTCSVGVTSVRDPEEEIEGCSCAVLEGFALSGCGLVRGGGAIMGVQRWRLNIYSHFSGLTITRFILNVESRLTSSLNFYVLCLVIPKVGKSSAPDQKMLHP